MTFTQPVIIQAPASKSLSHRALIAAALAGGASRLTNVLESEDTLRTMDILGLSGASIRREGPGVFAVSGVPRGPAGAPLDRDGEPMDMDVGESGTTCRLLTAVLAAGQGAFLIRGRGKMHARPVADLVTALIGQGAQIRYMDRPGCPPMLLQASGLAGGETAVSLDESSQYLSGLLLAAPLARKELAVAIVGSKVVSWPYVGLTLQVMEDFGARFRVQVLEQDGWADVPWRNPGQAVPGRLRIVVRPGGYRPRDMAVEGDWSNASYFLAAGALGPDPVGVSGLRPDSLQGDRAILDILQRMGAAVHWDGDTVLVQGGDLCGVSLDMGHCPDLVPTVAVLAAQARGETVISNAAHLRIKESDRLEAVATGLKLAGAGVDVLEDGLRIRPAALPAGRRMGFATYGDHRLAMSLSLLEFAGIGVDLDQPGCVAKSFPEFWARWKELKDGPAQNPKRTVP